MTEYLTRSDVVKFFMRNKRKKITFPTKNYFWEETTNWKTTNFPQDPLINNILSCILYSTKKIKYNTNGEVLDEQLEEVKNILHDKNLQQTHWSKKKIFECINIGNINNDFFLFLCNEFYINIIICDVIGVKFYYLDDEFDKYLPTLILQSKTDDITKQNYYQVLYKNEDDLLFTDTMLNEFIEYKDKFTIGLDKNKKFTIKNYSMVEKDDDIVQMDKIRGLDEELSEEDLYNEFEEI
jgi:hypothetical protein